MNVAIIGSGNVGTALAGSLRRAGHDVTLTAADPQSAKEAAAATGARAAESNSEAAATAEVVILAVPYGVVEELLDEIGDVIEGKVLIDSTNPLTPDYSDLATWGKSAAEQIQERLPRARVVKAFNTVFASRQADPVVDGTPVDCFIATDDDEARSKVLDLVRSMGLRPIDAGPLRMARALEAMGYLHIALQVRAEGTWQAGWKLVGPIPEKATTPD